MDPDAAPNEMLEAVQEGGRARATEMADALDGWIANGGSPPKTIGPWKPGQIWHVAMTKTIVKHARAHVRVVARQGSQGHAP